MTLRFRPDILLCLAALLAPLMAVFAPHGMVPLSLLVALGYLAAAPRLAMVRQWSPWVLLPLAALPAWAAVTALWGINPRGSFLAALQLAAVIVIGGVMVAGAAGMKAQSRKALLACLVVGTGVAWALLFGLSQGIDLLTPLFRLYSPNAPAHPVFIYGRSFVVLMVLSPAVVLAGWQLGGWRLALPLAALALACAAATHSVAVKGGTLLAVIAAVGAWRFARPTIFVLRAVIVAIVLAAPLIPAAFPPPQVSWETMRWIPFSAHHRMTIWQFTTARIAEKPVLGWGMDTARDIPGGEDIVLMVRDDARIPEQMMPLHPHNAPLQIWMELGAVGAVIAALLLYGLAGVPGRVPAAPLRAGMTASLAAAMAASLVSFGAWQSWWLCTLALIAALWSALGSQQAAVAGAPSGHQGG